MRLQKASGKDIRKIAEIYKTEYSKFPWNEKWTFPLALKKIKDYAVFCEIWKLNSGKDLVGFAIVNVKGSIGLPDEVAFLEEIAVKSSCQRKGLGTFILKEILGIYKKRGFKTIMGIASKKGKLLDFYKGLNIKPSKYNILIEGRLK
jgi:ribosomal protein S18 acetylase RimI-like enzyme